MKLTVAQEKEIWNELSVIFAKLDMSNFGKQVHRTFAPTQKVTDQNSINDPCYFRNAWKALWTRNHVYLIEIINIALGLIEDARNNLKMDANNSDIKHTISEIHRLKDKYLALEKDLNVDLIQRELKEIKDNQNVLFKKLDEINLKMELLNINIEKKPNKSDIADILSIRAEIRAITSILINTPEKEVVGNTLAVPSEIKRDKKTFGFIR